MKRYIPIKNYFIAAFTILVIVGLSIYAYRWYKISELEQTRECYLIKTNTISMEITDVNNMQTILMDAPSDYFIYISYTRSTDVLNLEKDLKKVIDKYGINNDVYYINTSKKNSKNKYLDIINDKFGISITSTPAIIYVKDGQVTEENIIQSKDGIIKASSFEKLLKNNDVEKISQ